MDDDIEKWTNNDFTKGYNKALEDFGEEIKNYLYMKNGNDLQADHDDILRVLKELRTR